MQSNLHTRELCSPQDTKKRRRPLCNIHHVKNMGKVWALELDTYSLKYTSALRLWAHFFLFVFSIFAICTIRIMVPSAQGGWKDQIRLVMLISWDIVHDQETLALLIHFQRQCVLLLPSFLALLWFLFHLSEIIFSSLFRFWFSLQDGSYNIKITRFGVRVFGFNQ